MEEKITFNFFEDSIEESTNKIARYFHLDECAVKKYINSFEEPADITTQKFVVDFGIHLGTFDSSNSSFLLPELMNDSYVGLTGMPEIFSDIMVSLNRRDIQQEYFEKKTCYLATVSTPIEKMIFDCADPRMSNQEKTQKIIQYLLCYVGYKKTGAASYVTNPMVRLADSYCVPANEIVDIREIYDWKEIFEH